MEFIWKTTTIVLSIILLLGILYAIYIRITKKHTKERFAFFALNSMVLLSINLSPLLLKQPTLLEIAINYFLPSIGITDKFIIDQTALISILIMFISIVIMSIFFFINWNGPKSEREIENDRNGYKSNVLFDATAFIMNNKARRIFIPMRKKEVHIDLSFQKDLRQWHIKVAELLILTDNQYRIYIPNFKDKKGDWFSSYNCYISKYGNQFITIICFKELNEDSLNRTEVFLKAQKKDFLKKIIAIEATIGELNLKKLSDKGYEVINETALVKKITPIYSNYLNSIEEDLNRYEIEDGCGFTINDVYLPLSAKKEVNNKKESIQDIEKYILEWVNEKSNKHIALLGEYGQGKSVLSKKISYELLINIEQYSRIPILIELRGKSVHDRSRQEIIGICAYKYGMNPQSLLELHSRGKLLLIFEGFDEISLAGDYGIRMKNFRKLLEFTEAKNSKIIITGRPNFFTGKNEMNKALGIYEPVSSKPYCEPINLDKLSTEKIELFLNRIPNIKRKGYHKMKLGILETLKREGENSTFYDVISRPSLLFMLCTIWEPKKLGERSHINSAIVFKEFINLNYERQNSKDFSEGDRPLLMMNERAYFMQGISVGIMMKKGYTNQIDNKDLNELINILYKNIPNEVSDFNTNLDNHIEDEPLKIRMSQRVEAMDNLQVDIRGSGLLVHDSTAEKFKFSHKSYFEYLVAEYYVNYNVYLKKNSSERVITQSISNSLKFGDNSYLGNPQTDGFIAELLANKFKFKDNEGKYKSPQDYPNEYTKAIYSMLCPYRLLKKVPKVVTLFSSYQIIPWSFLVFLLSISIISCEFYLGKFGVDAVDISLQDVYYVIAIISFFSLIIYFPLFYIYLICFKTSKLWKRIFILLQTLKELKISDKQNVVPLKYYQELNINFRYNIYKHISKLFLKEVDEITLKEVNTTNNNDSKFHYYWIYGIIALILLGMNFFLLSKEEISPKSASFILDNWSFSILIVFLSFLIVNIYINYRHKMNLAEGYIGDRYIHLMKEIIRVMYKV